MRPRAARRTSSRGARESALSTGNIRLEIGFSAWRQLVIGEIDLEQTWIDLLAGIQIVDGDRRVISLWIGYRPLLELPILGAHHQHQPAGADQRLFFLNGDADEHVVRRDADDVGVLQKVNAVR